MPIESENLKIERALLVGTVLPGRRKEEVQESLEELARLAETAGAEVIGAILQERGLIDPATLVGTGKVHEVARRAAAEQADLVIFDEDLTPVQVKNLEQTIQKKVVDRTGLILDIFARRARTHEAQIQVELAQLKYLLPRLTRRWTHLSRQEGGIGTRGPGETQLESDRRMIRRRIQKLEVDLARIENQRRVRRKPRQSLRKVALVGYTNAGKSSLMNALTHADVFVEDRLFATLDPTIRAFRIGHRRVLLIDTVGFIRKLPAHLVASFRSTLEETVVADLILHVIDVSHPRFVEHIGTVQDVLRDLGVTEKPVVYVFNKIDLLTERTIFFELRDRYAPAVFISATRGIGLEALKREIERQLEALEEEVVLRIPFHAMDLEAFVYARARVISKRYEEDALLLTIRAPAEVVKQIRSRLFSACAPSSEFPLDPLPTVGG